MPGMHYMKKMNSGIDISVNPWEVNIYVSSTNSRRPLIIIPKKKRAHTSKEKEESNIKKRRREESGKEKKKTSEGGDAQPTPILSSLDVDAIVIHLYFFMMKEMRGYCSYELDQEMQFQHSRTRKSILEKATNILYSVLDQLRMPGHMAYKDNDSVG
jgi:hypothetical protein